MMEGDMIKSYDKEGQYLSGYFCIYLHVDKSMILHMLISRNRDEFGLGASFPKNVNYNV